MSCTIDVIFYCAVFLGFVFTSHSFALVIWYDETHTHCLITIDSYLFILKIVIWKSSIFKWQKGKLTEDQRFNWIISTSCDVCAISNQFETINMLHKSDMLYPVIGCVDKTIKGEQQLRQHLNWAMFCISFSVELSDCHQSDSFSRFQYKFQSKSCDSIPLTMLIRSIEMRK